MAHDGQATFGQSPSPPITFSLNTQVMGIQGLSITREDIEKILRHYGRTPRHGEKIIVAWQLKQLEMELDLTREDRLSIIAGTARPYVPPPRREVPRRREIEIARRRRRLWEQREPEVERFDPAVLLARFPRNLIETVANPWHHRVPPEPARRRRHPSEQREPEVERLNPAVLLERFRHVPLFDIVGNIWDDQEDRRVLAPPPTPAPRRRPQPQPQVPQPSPPQVPQPRVPQPQVPQPQAPPPPPPPQAQQTQASQQAPRSRLQPTETCQVCLTDLGRLSFPKRRITTTCTHEPKICLECLDTYISHAISNTRWNLLTCPLCPSPLTFTDMAEHASPTDFARYDHLSLLATLSTLPDFRFCLNPACNSGQIHISTPTDPEQREREEGESEIVEFENLMTCEDCGARSCFLHQVPWHEGRTCEAFDREIREGYRRRREEEEANRRFLGANTKVCPNGRCGIRIQKRDRACDHMKCTLCAHEFCYRCLAPYSANMTHKADCRLNNPALPPGIIHYSERYWTEGGQFRWDLAREFLPPNAAFGHGAALD